MDTIPEVLLKLLENSSLVTLIFGVLLIVLGGAENLPLGNTTLTISSTVKVILLIVGVALTLISILALFKGTVFRAPKRESKELIATKQKNLEQEEQIKKLNNIIEEIKEFIGSRNDEISLSLIDILKGVESETRKFEKAGRGFRLAAQWLLNNQELLLQSTQFSDLNGKNLDSFRSEIQRYIELLVEGLEKFKYITPKARDITFHIGNPFPYIHAMQSVKARIKQEIDKHQDLEETELERLNRSIDNLIKAIRGESSS
jgi:uncharacterized FlaG/YvyC family protein